MSQSFCPNHPCGNCPQEEEDGICPLCGYDFDDNIPMDEASKDELNAAAKAKYQAAEQAVKAEAVEAADYEKSRGSIERLEALLRKWPKGDLAGKAQAELEELKSAKEEGLRNKAIAEAVEAADYKLSQGSIEWLEGFLKKWPRGKLSVKALAELKELKLKEAKAEEMREETLWKTAQVEASEAAYLNYKKETVLGRYRAEATARLEALIEACKVQEAQARDETRWQKAQGSDLETCRLLLAEAETSEVKGRIEQWIVELQKKKPIPIWARAVGGWLALIALAIFVTQQKDELPVAVPMAAPATVAGKLSETAVGSESLNDSKERILLLEKNIEEMKRLDALKASAARAAAVPPAPNFVAKQEFRDRYLDGSGEGPPMVVIPAGSFEMGSNDGHAEEKPVHTVRLARPFALGKTEVTQRQWRDVMGIAPPELMFKGCDDCPVESVSWNDAQKFVKTLSEKTKQSYRLPSESEWEYACRAGGKHTYCGFDDVASVVWYHNSGAKTHPVASKQPNAWGLYGMSGNVMEWVEDCWNDSYNREGRPDDGLAWSTGDCDRRVLRGGSWGDYEWVQRSYVRDGLPLGIRSKMFGFRVARTLP